MTFISVYPVSAVRLKALWKQEPCWIILFIQNNKQHWGDSKHWLNLYFKNWICSYHNIVLCPFILTLLQDTDKQQQKNIKCSHNPASLSGHTAVCNWLFRSVWCFHIMYTWCYVIIRANIYRPLTIFQRLCWELYWIISSNTRNNSGHYYFSHFEDEKTASKRGSVM